MKNKTIFAKLLFSIRWVFAGVIIALASSGHAAGMKVTLLTPEPPENPFWRQVIDFAKAVAVDMDIELDVTHPSKSGDASSFIVKRLGLKAINHSDKPDYFLTGYWSKGSPTIDVMEAAIPYDIHFFFYNTDIAASERRNIGRPRGKYANWIGYMHPDDIQAGFELTDILVQSYVSADQSIKNIVVIGGDETSQVSSKRFAGLQQRIENDNEFRVAEAFNTTWSRASAQIATQHALRKHPNMNILWTVSSEIALGSIQELKKRGKQPGKDILVVGFDWSSEALKAISEGELVASMGGHFMEAGWALILLYDYHNGVDFKDDLGVEYVTKMQAITQSNVGEYLTQLGDRNWNKIDFTKFSKVKNPQLKNYDFSLEAIFSSMKQSL